MRRSGFFGAGLAVLAVVAMLPLMKAHSETAVKIDAPAVDAAPAEGLQTAVIAGGCFWGIQAVYQHINGVTKAVSGYAGGDKKDASYELVSSGRTGHAEAVQITYDPRVISYGKILQIFFSVAHNPTELNRQGPDSGPQYRTEIFPQTDEQAKVAKAYVAQLDAAKAFPQADRDQDRHHEGRVLSGRGLSPGLRHPASEQPLHRLQRRAEGGKPQAHVPGRVPRQARAGGGGR